MRKIMKRTPTPASQIQQIGLFGTSTSQLTPQQIANLTAATQTGNVSPRNTRNQTVASSGGNA